LIKGIVCKDCDLLKGEEIMTKQELIEEIKKRMSVIYLAMDAQVADDLHRIFVETLNHLEKN
jgi:hypothetical protein